MFKRDCYQRLLNWKAKVGRKPLILQGARQVGKTHLLRRFAESEFQQVIYLNFETQQELADYFEGDLTPARIIENLATLFQLEIDAETTCFIFDEIQECPSALNSLKYFCEHAPEYTVMAAGSLLGVKLTSAGFPVGKVDFLTLKPLSFFEYLDALGHHKWRSYLEDVSAGDKIPEMMHSELMREFRFYLVLGGMPAVIAEYVKTKSLEAAREVQHAIINAYELDFAKHAPANQVVRISEIWHSIPAQLARENKKFVFSVIAKSARGRDYEQAIEWLRQAGLILKIKQASSPKIPLKAYAENDVFKIYCLDVGLLGALSGLPVELAVQQARLFTEFKGSLVENVVIQEFSVEIGEDLFYWSSAGKAEIDLLIAQGLDIYPLEIKSGPTRHKKSLLVFQEKFHPPLLLRTNPLGLKREEGLLNVPLYLARRLVAGLLG